MHLDSTFNILFNGTNYKSEFHREMGDFWGKVDFSQFSPNFFNKFDSRFLLTPPK